MTRRDERVFVQNISLADKLQTRAKPQGPAPRHNQRTATLMVDDFVPSALPQRSPAIPPHDATTRFVFRAFWPIVDETVPFLDLVRVAKGDLPFLLERAHARPLAPRGRWRIMPSADLAGSGRQTATVLVVDVPAVPEDGRPMSGRPYAHRLTSRATQAS